MNLEISIESLQRLYGEWILRHSKWDSLTLQVLYTQKPFPSIWSTINTSSLLFQRGDTPQIAHLLSCSFKISSLNIEGE